MAADIDVFDGVRQYAVFFGNGFSKRVQVYDNKVNWRNSVLLHNFIIGATPAQNAAMNFRVQGLYATVHHFREVGNA